MEFACRVFQRAVPRSEYPERIRCCGRALVWTRRVLRLDQTDLVDDDQRAVGFGVHFDGSLYSVEFTTIGEADRQTATEKTAIARHYLDFVTSAELRLELLDAQPSAAIPAMTANDDVKNSGS